MRYLIERCRWIHVGTVNEHCRIIESKLCKREDSAAFWFETFVYRLHQDNSTRDTIAAHKDRAIALAFTKRDLQARKRISTPIRAGIEQNVRISLD